MKKNHILFILFILLTLSVNAQWEHLNGPTGGHINCITSIGNNIYAGTFNGGVYLSTNGGDSWETRNNGLSNLNVTDLAVSGTDLYAGTDGSGVFLSTNLGETWTQVNNGLPNMRIMRLAANDSTIFTCFSYIYDSPGIYKSTDHGASWKAANDGLVNLFVYSIIVKPGIIYVGTDDIMHYSTNNGIAWMPMSEHYELMQVNYYAIKDSIHLAGTANNGLLMSYDYGESWHYVKNIP